LRREVRAARRELTESHRDAADRRILAGIRSMPAFRAARRVALFFAFDGEPDLSTLFATDRNKQFFAPVITPSDMQFAAVGGDTVLTENFFGIPEPAELTLIDPRSLDLVLTPLVAFDLRGNRIGVGAGYYDRCFSFLLRRRHWHHPKLVGTAYALQEFKAFEPNAWDVPLWAAVTETTTRYFR
jgi:5-formyltetrahydrofolate cyclo-ligase